MTEHVHEWKIIPPAYENSVFITDGCGNHLTIAEAEARLNATERLSAEDAELAAKWSGSKELENKLIAYANILEKK